VNLSVFEERSMIGQFDEVLNQIYCWSEDALFFVVASISLSEWIEKSQIVNLIPLSPPCITAPIGFVFPAESAVLGELRIVRLYAEGGSLAEVISVNPEWWTATEIAKVVIGVVLALRFAHSLGLLHGHLNSSNMVFDANHHIQIANFDPIRLEVRESQNGGFSGTGWTPQMDVRGFGSILFEILFGQPRNGEPFVPANIPEFVSKIIEAGLCSESEIQYSFCNIFEILKQNSFQIMEGVDSEEVLAFAN
jgi:hypothetical protein